MQENLINDLMDLGKLERGIFRVENEYFSLPQVVQQAFQIVKATADQKQIKLIANIQKMKNLAYFQQLHGDSSRFL